MESELFDGLDPELVYQLQCVDALLSLGFSLFPVAHKTKRPIVAWSEYQRRHPTEDEVLQWFARPMNIGVVTGAISNIVAVDCDSDEADAWADAHLPDTPLKVQTRKGTHRYYRHPQAGLVPNKAKIVTPDGKLALDIRGDGGYVAGPGSVHETGHVYRMLGDWSSVSMDDVPLFEAKWIGLREFRQREELDPEIEKLRQAFIDERVSPATRVERAKQYLSKLPPAIEGQGGDDQTIRIALLVVRDFALTDAEALEALRDYNQRCSPPWTEAELRTKVQNARRYGKRPIGSKLIPTQQRQTSLQTLMSDVASFGRGR